MQEGGEEEETHHTQHIFLYLYVYMIQVVFVDYRIKQTSRKNKKRHGKNEHKNR